MITVTRLMAKQCPYASETDVGTLTVTCPGCAPELHDLAAQVDKIAAAPVSHEEFTFRVAALLPLGSTVTWTTQTGPWSMEVTETGASA